MDKLSKEIFTNEYFFDTFLEEKNYIIIKKFEQFSRRKNSSINYFYEFSLTHIIIILKKEF